MEYTVFAIERNTTEKQRIDGTEIAVYDDPEMKNLLFVIQNTSEHYPTRNMDKIRVNWKTKDKEFMNNTPEAYATLKWMN